MFGRLLRFASTAVDGIVHPVKRFFGSAPGHAGASNSNNPTESQSALDTVVEAVRGEPTGRAKHSTATRTSQSVGIVAESRSLVLWTPMKAPVYSDEKALDAARKRATVENAIERSCATSFDSRPEWASPICLLHIKSVKNGSEFRTQATGFLLKTGLVATSAHVIEHPEYGKAYEITVMPSHEISATKSNVHPQISRTFRHCLDWDNNVVAASDYAAIILPNPEKFAVCGYFILEPPYDPEPNDDYTVVISGYVGGSSEVLRTVEGSVPASGYYDHTIQYSLSTEDGQSGSPVLLKISSTIVKAVGIHSKASSDDPGTFIARRATIDMLDDFSAWANEVPSS